MLRLPGLELSEIPSKKTLIDSTAKRTEQLMIASSLPHLGGAVEMLM